MKVITDIREVIGKRLLIRAIGGGQAIGNAIITKAKHGYTVAGEEDNTLARCRIKAINLLLPESTHQPAIVAGFLLIHLYGI